MWFQIPQYHYVKVSQGFSVIRLLLWDLSCNHLLIFHLNFVALQLYGMILIQFLSSLSKKLSTIWNLLFALMMFSPPRILKQIFDSVGPSLVSFLNKCLVSGTIPDSLKKAIVTPLLKKPSLDTSNFNNFQPISNLPFITKALEKTVFIQLQSFLSANHIFETFQSGFKPLHSTESALLRVLNDTLLATDSGDSVILILLDLTSALIQLIIKLFVSTRIFCGHPGNCS